MRCLESGLIVSFSGLESPFMRSIFLALLPALAFPAMLHAQTPTTDPVDPYIWLEEGSSPRAMAWVQSHNAVTTKPLEADGRYARNYADALELAGAKDRI